jgi:RNA polymerase sigma-70 factor (ECF subfamily)
LEKQLLKEIRAGRREASEQLVRANYAAVYRFLVHCTQDADLAEDLTQETFGSAWRKIGDFDGKVKVGTWLHKIAYHKLLDAWRSRHRSKLLAANLALHRGEPERPSPIDELAADERALCLAETVQALDETERLFIVLHYFQGLSYRQMATVLGEPVGSIKWRTSRALLRLKELLAANTDHENPARKTTREGDCRTAGGRASKPATAGGAGRA